MDSVQFALALERYDIVVHQPHPPGYFLYVMMGKLVNIFIRDANAVFIFISIIFSALTVVTVYFLGKELFGEKTGIIASALTITSPNFWFHGEVALTYAAEAFFSVALAFFCWKMLKGEHKYLWLSAIMLAVAGGIRQNTLVFLLPLWLFSVKGAPIKKVILALGLLLLLCLFWFIPMVRMTGGWSAYQEAFRELWLFNTGHVSVFERGWPSFKIFSSSLLDFTIYGIGAGVLILVGLAVYSLFRNGKIKCLEKSRVIFFSVWMLPSVFFYLMIFIHPANPGYVLIFLPALLMLTAASIGYISAELKALMKKDIFMPIAVIIIAINICIFFLSTYPVSYAEIRKHDKALSAILAGIRTFDPAKTAVFVRPYVFFGYRHIMYYLPEYSVYQVDIRVAPTGERRKTFWGVNRKTFLTEEIHLPENISNIVIPLISDDRDKVSGIKNLTIRKLLPQIYLAEGPAALLKEIYPELSIGPLPCRKD